MLTPPTARADTPPAIMADRWLGPASSLLPLVTSLFLALGGLCWVLGYKYLVGWYAEAGVGTRTFLWDSPEVVLRGFELGPIVLVILFAVPVLLASIGLAWLDNAQNQRALQLEVPIPQKRISSNKLRAWLIRFPRLRAVTWLPWIPKIGQVLLGAYGFVFIWAITVMLGIGIFDWPEGQGRNDFRRFQDSVGAFVLELGRADRKPADFSGAAKRYPIALLENEAGLITCGFVGQSSGEVTMLVWTDHTELYVSGDKGIRVTQVKLPAENTPYSPSLQKKFKEAIERCRHHKTSSLTQLIGL